MLNCVVSVCVCFYRARFSPSYLYPRLGNLLITRH